MLAEIFGLDAVVVVVVAVVVIFGGSQIPKLARSLGSAQREFRNGQRHGAEAPSENAESGAGETLIPRASSSASKE